MDTVENTSNIPFQHPVTGGLSPARGRMGFSSPFFKVVFRVNDGDGLKERLMSLKSFDFDETKRTWTWLKKADGKRPSFPATHSGTVTLERGCLIGEALSEEWAIRLMNKIQRYLKDSVSFERIEVKDHDDVPPPAGKARRRIETEQEEPMKSPDMAAEKYFHNDWIRGALSVLGNKAPIDAIKTPEGKREVEKILDNLELTLRKNQGTVFHVDVNGLRRRLGIPVKHGS